MNKENIFSNTGVASKKAKTNYFTGPIIAKDISAVIKPMNEKIIILAKNIDLTNLDDVINSEVGKKYTKEKFGRVIAEKTEEFLKTQADRASGASGGGYSGGHRRIKH